jgi:hypothetical protein
MYKNSNVYTYVANNYYKMSIEELKTITLEALAFIEDETDLAELLKNDFDIDIEDKE